MDKGIRLYLGIIIVAVFWLTTVVCGFVHGTYNHFSMLVSELGAIGTKSQYVFSAGLIVCSVLSVIFIIELCRICRKKRMSIIPVLLILLYSISILGVAIFPLPHRFHLMAGSPSFFLVFSPVLAMILWRKKLSSIIPFSILCMLIMLLGVLTFFPEIMSNFTGLKQRFFHTGYSLWFIYLSYAFVRLSKNNSPQISIGKN